MKLAWAHDHYFLTKHNEDTVYSEVEFPYDMWKRYLHSFDQLTVICREKRIDTSADIKRFNISSGERVSFVGVADLNRPAKKLMLSGKVKTQIRSVLKNSDGLIARLPSTIGVMAIKEAQKLGLPWGVELVGCPWDAFNNLNNWKAKIYAPIVTRDTKNAVGSSLYTLYVTKNFLQSRYPTKGKSVSCSNVNINIPSIQVLERRLERDIEKDRIIIGLIGYLSFYKGIDTAIEAIAELSKTYENVELQVLGGGDYSYWMDYASQKGLAESKLTIKTLPSGKPVLDWLDQIDIYIQPSRTEGLPRGLVEAMSRGCPAVASSAGGIPELMREEFLHSPGESEKLASLINKIILNKDLSRRLSEENFYRAKEYDKEVLESIRRNFWSDFANHIKETKKEVE